jgi:hypothetical protein
MFADFSCCHLAGFHHTVSRHRGVCDNPDYMKPVTLPYIKIRGSAVFSFGPYIKVKAYEWDSRLASLQTYSQGC